MVGWTDTESRDRPMSIKLGFLYTDNPQLELNLFHLMRCFESLGCPVSCTEVAPCSKVASCSEQDDSTVDGWLSPGVQHGETHFKNDLPLLEFSTEPSAHSMGDFLTLVNTHKICRHFLSKPITAARLIELHVVYKYLIMAYSQKSYQIMGLLVSNLKDVDLDNVAKSYIDFLKNTVTHSSKNAGHANALSHIKGYLTSYLTKSENQQLVDDIELLRKGFLPLQQIKDDIREHIKTKLPDSSYIGQQAYLQPMPSIELIVIHTANPVI